MENMTALTVQHQAALAPAAFFSPDQEKMILQNFLGGASRDEAAVLLEIVKRRRLDPFSRQVYFVKRWDAQKRAEVWAIQTSIDGLRTIAERTGKYDGQDEPVYGEDEAGKFCKVKVYRKDWSSGRGAVGVAYEAEFIQKKKDGQVTQFWARMPRLMLAKCAEALAIRKAFPEDTGGIYIAEEMPDPIPEERQRLPAKRAEVAPETVPASEAQANIAAAAEVLGATVETMTVSDLWGEAGREFGETGRPAAWQKACATVFGAGVKPPPAKDWTRDQIALVEACLFPKPPPPGTDDIPF